MQIAAAQLAHHIKRGLSSLYLLSGDEPLQLQEAHTLLLNIAKQHDYDTRIRFDVDNHFDWSELLKNSQNISLFASKQIIDLNMPSGKPGTQGSQILQDYVNNPAPDTLLIIRTGKLEAATLRSKWVKAIEKQGVLVIAKPIPLYQLSKWLQQRLAHVGLSTQPEGLQLLAEKTEGNLLAAAQAIEKLHLLYGEGTLSIDQIRDAIQDSAKYDVFTLVDACMQGNTNRSLHILQGLRSEGSAPAVVLWALAREVRLLAMLAFQLQHKPLPDLIRESNIWDKRKALTANALKRLSLTTLHDLLSKASSIDASIKGLQMDDPWQGLNQLCLHFSQVSTSNNLH